MSLKNLIPQLDEGKRIVIQQKNRTGENQIEDSQIANQITNITINVDASNVGLLRELLGDISFNESTKEFKENILPIEKLISDGKTNLAIDKFNELIKSKDFPKYSKDEKFLVYNGLLNCHVNNQADESEIIKWSSKIEVLGEVKEIHRYYYIKAIWKYNLKDYKVAKTLNNQAIKAKPDYINALSCDFLIRCMLMKSLMKKQLQGLKNYLRLLT
ncbi:hypothetical protein [Vallitalea sp.]|jgi:hypothetical protein|uniref:hypothetical protein n=1 Tax=Vallitalea sp. TaxID=1882829 RepID=UPI0025F19647|nr:hypothetical protein [Vallitalea sp.]MCT4687512.1 hypothetical protein [Vallitalea sp.]